ncbi:MAG TPA: WbqC family protein [Bacteroidales bacterium]|nr:WbqC family protein [Bacteroidales bacterium]
MKISSHQPNFIPWAGYFYKISISDAFVIADDLDYSRKSYINRNRIKTPEGSEWLTLPVKKMPLGTPINEIEISCADDVSKLLKTVKSCYARAAYFKMFFEKFEEAMWSGGSNLSEINIALINLVLRELKIETPIYRTSALSEIAAGSTDRIISICRAFGADTYISGLGGQNYQSAELMKANGIECRVYKFRHPEYSQLWGKFEANLSVIDLIFNCGPDAERILKSI